MQLGGLRMTVSIVLKAIPGSLHTVTCSQSWTTGSGHDIGMHTFEHVIVALPWQVLRVEDFAEVGACNNLW